MPCVTGNFPDNQGPLLPIVITCSQAFTDVLRKENPSIEIPLFSGKMLIDTGASHSMVDKKVIEKLGLKPHGAIKICTPSSTDHEVRTFDVDIIFPHHNNARMANIIVSESDFSSQNIDGLIGRDILKIGLLVYHGYTGQFSLAF